MRAVILCNVLTAVAVAHATAALALLIAVLGGSELRTIIGLLGAVAFTAAWALWLREQAQEAQTIERAAKGTEHLRTPEIGLEPNLKAAPEPADRAA